MKKLSAVLLLSVLVLASACSASVSVGGGSKVKRSEVESQAKAAIEDSAGGTVDVTCPDDLDGEEGATMTCTFSADTGETGDAVIEVTSVDGTDVKFSVHTQASDDGTGDGGTDTGS